MSGESLPITAAVFADAIKELPLSAIYAKVSELRNSISHLRRSNDELRSFITTSCESDDDKRELESYIVENETVITSMEERTMLLKTEVENRGQLWIEVENSTDASTDGGGQGPPPTINGTAGDSATSGAAGADTHHDTTTRGTSANDSSGNTNEGDGDGVYL